MSFHFIPDYHLVVYKTTLVSFLIDPFLRMWPSSVEKAERRSLSLHVEVVASC